MTLLERGEPISWPTIQPEYARLWRELGADLFSRMLAQVKKDVQILEENRWDEWEQQLREPPA